MGSDGDEGSVSGQVLVQLVLQGDEGVVAFGGELDVAQDGAGNVGSDLERVGGDGDGLGLGILGLDDLEVGGLYATAEDVEVEGDALEAEHVISVGGDFDLELGRLLLAIDDGSVLALSVLVELDAELEA